MLVAQLVERTVHRFRIWLSKKLKGEFLLNKYKKKFIIAGNWKMNKTVENTKKWFHEVIYGTKKTNCELITCIPFINIPAAIELSKNSQISIGAQNSHFENFGPYTGEISPHMLQDFDVKYVILGHSERRNCFFETDELINKKIIAAINSGLKVILCVGETSNEKNFNVTEEKISMQLKIALHNVDKKSLENLIIAYEPIWAIGSGKSASKEDINRICGKIKSVLFDIYKSKHTENIPVIYGGSINAQNVHNLLSIENIDGVLIGGASLDPKEFLEIIKICQDNLF